MGVIQKVGLIWYNIPASDGVARDMVVELWSLLLLLLLLVLRGSFIRKEHGRGHSMKAREI